MTAPALSEVTSESPCPICTRTTWCGVSDDRRTVICRRVSFGCRTLATDRAGVPYFIHNLESLDDPGRLGRCSRETRNSSSRTRRTTLSPAQLDVGYRAILGALHLADGHRTSLIQRGLTTEQVDQGGYKSLPSSGRHELGAAVLGALPVALARELPGLAAPGIGGGTEWRCVGASGLVVPVRNIDGLIIALKVRRDSTGSGPKYVYVSSSRVGGASPGAPAHVPIFAAANRDKCRLTEGELKSDIATVLSGMRTISVSGAGNWRTALPILHELGVKSVRLAFDADARRNPHVALALVQAARALSREGY